MSLPTPQFMLNLMSISNQLTTEDLEKMKFFIQGNIPKGKLQSITKPYELFSVMMENDMLSPTNLNRLGELLESAGRLDLLPKTEAEGKHKLLSLSSIFALNLPLKSN